MARDFLNLAAAAYPSASNTSSRHSCLEKTYPTELFTVLVTLTTSCDKLQNECQAYSAVSVQSKTVILSFRGTEGISQLEQELRYGLIDYVVYNETDKSGVYESCGRVNKYFYRAMDDLWNAMVLPITRKYKGYRYYMTGHSLGGALAAMTAFRLSHKGVIDDPFDVSLITFGEPRAGDYDYATVFQKYVPYSFRVVHYTDPVPHLPPLHEDDMTAPANPFHHTREIWYDKSFKSYTLCSDSYGEDDSCSDNKRFWNYGKGAMSEHLIYFNHYISEYGWGGCVDSSSNLGLFSAIVISFYVCLHNLLE